MTSAKVPGKLTCYRFGENIFPSNYEAIHGGGAASFLLRYDIAKIFREAASSFYETEFSFQWNRYHSRLHCIVAQELYQTGHFDSLREWTPARFEGRCRIDAFRADHLSARFNAFAFDPEFIIADGYHLSYPIRQEQKSLYSQLDENHYDSIFTGTQQRLPNRFTVSRGNLQWTNRSLYDSLRTWTPDSYHSVFEQKGKLESLWYCRLASINDPTEWPTRVRKQYSGIVANPVFYQFRVSARNGFIDPLPWTSFLFGYDVFLYFFNGYANDRQAFVRPGWRIMAKNLETNEVTELGFINADNTVRSLENISLPEGDYEISVLTSSLFWKDTMDGNVRTISVRPGEEISPLPVIYNLRSSVSFGTRRIQWSASHSEIDECLFGIWYGNESPVDTNRTPDATVWYSASMTEFQTSFAQNAPAWVAVAAMRLDEESQVGKVHELYLDWSSVPPRAPDDVVVLHGPLPAIDTEIVDRALEEEDLAFVF